MASFLEITIVGVFDVVGRFGIGGFGKVFDVSLVFVAGVADLFDFGFF